MTDPPEVTDDLYCSALAIAREVAAKNERRRDEHLIEDMAKTLFLAGGQVWREDGNAYHQRDGDAIQQPFNTAGNRGQSMADHSSCPSGTSTLWRCSS